MVFFSLSPLWWRRIRGLWNLPYGIDWLRGILGLVLMGRAMLCKSLIKFSVDGWSCVTSLLFIWAQAMVEVMKIMVTSCKRSHACTAAVQAPNLAAGHHQPMPSPETPRHLEAGLLCGHCSFLLGPGERSSVVPSRSLWIVAYQPPQSMEFSRQEYWSGLPFPSPRDLPNPGIEPGCPALQADALPSEPPGKPHSGVNGDLLQENLCHTHTQSPCPCGRPLLTCTSTGDAQTHFCLSLCGVPESWCA